YEELGQTAKAEQKRELARTHLQNRLAEDARDTETRADLARLVLRNQNYDEAIRVLEEGRRLNPDDEKLQKLLAEVFVYRAQALPPATDPAVRIGLLANALKIDPDCTPAIHQLLHLSSGENRQAARN